jgi:heme o synthase
MSISVSQPHVSTRELAWAYVSLTKPRIMTLLLITTLAAMFIAERQQPLPAADFVRVVLVTLLGGALASGGAAALNCYLDRDIDAVMNRTRRRALPTGLLQPWQVLVYGLVLSVLAVTLVLAFVNPLAAALVLAGHVYYVVVYTMWLKRWTSQNIVIGGAAGAIPPLVGWAAVTGGLALPAVLLFAIIVAWTPAHFWALALLNRKDYAAAGVPMLPAVAGERKTKRRILVYAVLVVVATLVLYMVHAMGVLYLAVALALGSGLIYMALRLFYDQGHGQARRMFMYSNIYLALLFLAMVVDRLAVRP